MKPLEEFNKTGGIASFFMKDKVKKEEPKSNNNNDTSTTSPPTTTPDTANPPPPPSNNNDNNAAITTTVKPKEEKKRKGGLYNYFAKSDSTATTPGPVKRELSPASADETNDGKKNKKIKVEPIIVIDE